MEKQAEKCIRRRLLPCLLLSLSLLAGCAVQQEASFLNIKPHAEQLATDAPEEAQIEAVDNYLSLRTTLLALVGEHTAKSTLDVSQYGEGLAQDMDQAVDYVTRTDPVGAYAVNSIYYTLREADGQQLMDVEFLYRHTLEDIQSIRTVRGMINAQKLIEQALERFDDHLILQISGYDEGNFRANITQYCTAHPDSIMELPSVYCNVFPQSGKVRVVELRFTYTTSPEEMAAMREQVQVIFDAAKGYVSKNAGDAVGFQQLYAFLTERFTYTVESSVTPAYSLLCQGKGDSFAFANVFAALCSRSGLSCQVVHGTRDGVDWYWNLVKVEQTYYYVDLCGDLDEDQLLYRADSEMSAYAWQKDLYPPCGPQETQQPTSPTASEPTSEPAEPSSAPTDPSVPTEETEPTSVEETAEPTGPTEAPAPTEIAEEI